MTERLRCLEVHQKCSGVWPHLSIQGTIIFYDGFSNDFRIEVPIEPSKIIMWLKNVDRQLLIQGTDFIEGFYLPGQTWP